MVEEKSERKPTAAEFLGCVLPMMLIIVSALGSFIYFAGATLLTMMPWWVALPLGLVIGVVVFAISVAGETTLLEMAVRCGILLILVGFLVPVLHRARENALKAKRAGIHHTQTSPKPRIKSLQ